MPRAKKVMPKEDIIVKEVKVSEPPIKKVVPKKVDKDDYVDVVNNTTHILSFVNSRTTGEWMIEGGYGARDVMQVSDLVTMKSNQSKLLLEGWLVIDDEDVVNHLRLTELYKYLIKPDNIDVFFKSSESKMQEIVSKQPKGTKDLLAEMAKIKIENGEFDSITKQRFLENLLGVKFDSSNTY
ncbi:MAG TPA: hypothetical protein VIM42_12300 [Clostridium sp.]